LIRILFFVLLFIVSDLLGQEINSPIFIEHNSVIQDSSQSEIISYRIPYSNLLFVKYGETYKSSFTLTLEFFKKDDFVFREILNPELSIGNYTETLSNKKYFQDFLKLNIKAGTYTLKTQLSLGGTEMEYKIPPREIKIDSLSKIIHNPIIVYSKKKEENSKFTLANFANLLPFSSEAFSLLLGVSSQNIDTINVSISQKKKVIFSKSLHNFMNGSIIFNKADGNIVLTNKPSPANRYFIISDFSHLLYEGAFELTVKFDSTEDKMTFTSNWIGKPEVLNNPEYSIKLLSYIEKDYVVGELLSLSEDDYYSSLSDYWIEKFPANGMKYNFAMEEYYKRADHAIKNYSSLNSIDGAERDRGKIYILYGEPTSTERDYTEMNEIIEVWNYEDNGRKFIFKDVNGTGKFDIVK
jgi:GWxTD domain-containing protein